MGPDPTKAHQLTPFPEFVGQCHWCAGNCFHLCISLFYSFLHNDIKPKHVGGLWAGETKQKRSEKQLSGSRDPVFLKIYYS